MNEHMDPEDDYVMITDAEEHMRMKAAARQKTAEDTRAQLRSEINCCCFMFPSVDLIVCSTV
jgi:hypothetical protein